jgi:IS1 family transposase
LFCQCHFEIGNRGYKTAKKLFSRLAENYKINKFATNHWSVYFQTIPKEKHVTGKEFTQGIDNING